MLTKIVERKILFKNLLRYQIRGVFRYSAVKNDKLENITPYYAKLRKVNYTILSKLSKLFHYEVESN